MCLIHLLQPRSPVVKLLPLKFYLHLDNPLFSVVLIKKKRKAQTGGKLENVVMYYFCCNNRLD